MLEIDRQETLRYLGMASAQPNATFLSRLDAIDNAVCAAARPQACWRHVPVTVAGTSCRVGNSTFTSHHLAQNLKGCSHAFLFAATLGTEVDVLLRRYGQIAPADLVMAQAAATALIESYCDQCEKQIKKEFPNVVLRPRFSPGYGNFSLAHQVDLLSALDATKRIGITLTDAQLMIPSKSVSAIIGAHFTFN